MAPSPTPASSPAKATTSMRQDSLLASNPGLNLVALASSAHFNATAFNAAAKPPPPSGMGVGLANRACRAAAAKQASTALARSSHLAIAAEDNVSSPTKPTSTSRGRPDSCRARAKNPDWTSGNRAGELLRRSSSSSFDAIGAEYAKTSSRSVWKPQASQASLTASSVSSQSSSCNARAARAATAASALTALVHRTESSAADTSEDEAFD
mmetsp:Transcript_10077/g.29575  ORF Transcript_10077/g.29575 Transcript_10077/m.29575 type:complete len:210 (-) Transcript_10077:1203-1832(-)